VVALGEVKKEVARMIAEREEGRREREAVESRCAAFERELWDC
jgi:hypothetical protein